MVYKIKMSYRTGDSFGSSDQEEYLEMEWENVEIVKENLRRIAEHNDYYVDCNSYSTTKNIKKPDNYQDYSLELLADNGNTWTINTFWTGYFEYLYEAEIETDLDLSGFRYSPGM